MKTREKPKIALLSISSRTYRKTNVAPLERNRIFTVRDLLKNLYDILHHPLNKHQKAKALLRYLRWQLASRLMPYPIAVDFIGKARLLVKNGMTGATGNIYNGLHEFEEMAFILHSMRKEDLFIDVGANVGVYTVLTGSVVGAKTISIEPIPSTFEHLLDNIHLNRIHTRVKAYNLGAGDRDETLFFTNNLDAMNRVVISNSPTLATIQVPVHPLDQIVGSLEGPTFAKIDVEGFETKVVCGAQNILSSPHLQAVIMELNGSGKKYGFDEKALHKKMLAHGFTPYIYHPFQREFTPTDSWVKQRDNTIYLRDLIEMKKRVTTSVTYTTNSREI